MQLAVYRHATKHPQTAVAHLISGALDDIANAFGASPQGRALKRTRHSSLSRDPVRIYCEVLDGTPEVIAQALLPTWVMIPLTKG